MIELSPKIKLLIVGASFFLAAVVVAVIVLVVGQKGNVTKIQTISFSKANENFAVGESRELELNIYPSDAANKTIRYSSSNSNIVEVVSTSKNGVVLRAKSIGSAIIKAQSKSNKKLVDSCNIQVSDNIASSMSAASSASVVVGENTSIDVTLLPENANYQKIQVVSYDQTKIKAPTINIQNSKATIVVEAIRSGTSQLVIGFFAERNGSNVAILTKQIEIVCEPVLVNALNYEVKSNTNPVYGEQAPQFLIDSSNTYTFNFSYQTNSGKSGVLTNLEMQYDSSIFDVTCIGNECEIKLDSNCTSGWNQAYVVFEYEGAIKSLLFVEGNIEDAIDSFVSNLNYLKNSSKISNVYDLIEGSSYSIDLPNEVKKLVQFGFAEIGIVDDLNEGYVSLSEEGLIFTCNKVTDQEKSVGLYLKITYWNRSESFSGKQIDLNFTISERGFE